VAPYIANQEAHHRKFSLDVEFRMLLEKHGVEYDPKYMFGWNLSQKSLLWVAASAATLRGLKNKGFSP